MKSGTKNRAMTRSSRDGAGTNCQTLRSASLLLFNSTFPKLTEVSAGIVLLSSPGMWGNWPKAVDVS